MSQEGIPKKKFTVEEMEKLIEVKLAPSISKGDFLNFARNGVLLRFILTSDYNLYISNRLHTTLSEESKADLDTCLIDNGSFNAYANDQKITFNYKRTPMSDVQEASERRIMEFLKEHTITINSKSRVDLRLE
jgi:hypothetical protein